MTVKMTNMLSIDDVNREIQEYWNNLENRDGCLKYNPLFYSHPEKSKEKHIIFVGFNPSFSEKGFRRIHGKEASEIAKIFSEPMGENYKELSQWHDKKAQTSHPYFKPFRDFALHRKVSISHLDMFPIRHTSQFEVVDFLEKNQQAAELFFRWFMDVVAHYKPDALVICNAKAGQMYRKFQKEMIRYEEKEGVLIDRLDDEHEYRIFLGGMLTGQRAMDMESRKRLFWHIDRVFAIEHFFS